MKRCKQCNTEYNNRDNCPNCGSVEYWEVDVWGQPQEPKPQETAPVNLTKEQPQTPPQPQSPPTPPPYQPPNANQQQNYNGGQPQGQPAQPYGNPPGYADNGAKGMSVAGMVLGILSIILLASPFVGLGLGIVALCLGVASKKRLPQGEQGMATAGVVLGIIGIIIGAISSVLWGTLITMCNVAMWDGLNHINPYWYW